MAGLYGRFQGVIANQFDDELNLTDQHAAWKSMEHAWVFAGSQFVKEEQTGEQSYLADAEGELICVSNFPTAVLDVPIRSSGSNASLLFEAFTERIPPLGGNVRLEDAETGEETSLRIGEKEIAAYAAAAEAHIHALSTGANRAGMKHLLCMSDIPFENLLLNVLTQGNALR